MRRELRLKSSKDFARVYSQGKSKANKYLVLYYLNQDSAEPTKVGFSIGKKIGSAVRRNKLKRQLKAIISEQIEAIKPGFLLVFIVRRSARDLEFPQLKASAFDLLKRTNIFVGSACA